MKGVCVMLLAVCLVALYAVAQSAKPAPASTPTVDEIINRYIDAIGGRAALEKITSRASMGTISVPAMDLSGTVLIHEKAPNRLLQVIVINGNAFRQGFDGTTGWSDDPADGLRVFSGEELAEAQRDADFYQPLHLRTIYPDLRFAGTEKVGDRDAYVLEGAAPGENKPDKMYFDAVDGLALRFISHRHTADGEADVQEDFQDYRNVDGLELPFTMVLTGGSSDFTIRIAEVHDGVDLDDGEFAKPPVDKSKVE
ncbi:MAG TPA: hypothetical protein VMB47_17430 [Candidatus Aquilonibacter sp.]|nr:hypothetical protein [Candidatus Aquilonibacter sp.]